MMTKNSSSINKTILKMNTDNLKSNLDYALYYAGLGWHVFPAHTIIKGTCSCKKKNCRNSGKHPMTQHGLKDATIDPSKINYWWTKSPNANIAIRTGKVSGISVIDIDLKTNGFISLEKLSNRSVEPIHTLRSITGGKGNHLIYKHSGTPVKTRTGFMPGIDIRGENGYIIAPPSLHISGSYYEWHNINFKPVEMPQWLIDEINNHKEPISNFPIKSITEGSRNNYLMSVGGKKWSQGIKQSALRTYLLEENQLKCSPPLSTDEVLKTLKSLCRYKPGKEHFIFSWKRAFRDSNLPSSSKLVLHALADHMTSEGRSCYPTLERLENETTMTRKTISKHIKICMDQGFIKRYSHKSEHQQFLNHGYIAIIPDG